MREITLTSSLRDLYEYGNAYLYDFKVYLNVYRLLVLIDKLLLIK